MGRWLRTYQAESSAAIGTLTSQMESMTMMMEWMLRCIERIAPPLGMSPSDMGQAPTFVTPPPRSHTPLSPILEIPTPQPTPYPPPPPQPSPQTQNPPPFPPNLGSLTPSQLPVPPRMEDVRQKATMPEQEHPSSSRQIVQRTTPTTNPQYYQNSPRQQHDPPRHPTYQEQHYPHSYQPQHHNSAQAICCKFSPELLNQIFAVPLMCATPHLTLLSPVIPVNLNMSST